MRKYTMRLLLLIGLVMYSLVCYKSIKFSNYINRSTDDEGRQPKIDKEYAGMTSKDKVYEYVQSTYSSPGVSVSKGEAYIYLSVDTKKINRDMLDPYGRVKISRDDMEGFTFKSGCRIAVYIDGVVCCLASSSNTLILDNNLCVLM